jgi:hypothetical protein
MDPMDLIPWTQIYWAAIAAGCVLIIAALVQVGSR